MPVYGIVVYIKTVKKGRSVVVTSHGKPVAKIPPVLEDDRLRRRHAPPFSHGSEQHEL